MRGFFSMCRKWNKTRIDPAGLAEYIRIPEENLTIDTLKLSPKVSFEDGTLIEPTATVIKSIKRAELTSQDTVLVIGLGIMGQLHIILARYFGAKLIIGADRVDFRLRKALEMGADWVVNIDKENLKEKVLDYTQGFGVDLVFVGPGTKEAILAGFEVAGKGGRILLFTPTPEKVKVPFDTSKLYYNELTILSSYSAGPYETREALDLIERGVIDSLKLITHRFKIEEAPKAFAMVREAKNSLKVVIKFD